MTIAPQLAAFAAPLAALRFCPMAAPAGEVVGVSGLESHATRARAVQLWRISTGLQKWTARDAEIVHQTTLDSLSEAFDVYHAPVRSIMLAARADVWSAGLAPEPVKGAVAALREFRPRVPAKAATILIAGEAATDDPALDAARAVLQRAGIAAAVWPTLTGTAAHALGAVDLAREQLAALRDGIAASGASEAIADGPETVWALTRLAPALGVALPAGLRVRSLLDVLATRASRKLPGPVFVHDARAAFLLADTPPEAVAVMPGYDRQPGAAEAACGTGAVYDTPRRVVEAGGAARVWGVWSRGLARSSGADDGLSLAYPGTAAALAVARLGYARTLGAPTLATDSPAAAAWLRRHRTAGDPQVTWLPEVL